jgi:hypothetical protein
VRDHLHQNHYVYQNVCHIKNTKTVCEYREKAPWKFYKNLCRAKAEGSEGHKVKLSIHRCTCTVLVSQHNVCRYIATVVIDGNSLNSCNHTYISPAVKLNSALFTFL